MKMLTMMFSAVVLAFSSGALASSSNDQLKVLQDACYLKQVPRLCAVNLPDKSYIGRCVDAKAYGLICVHYRQR